MIVLDASAALEMVQRTKAGNTLEGLVYNGETIISVDLLYGEVLSAFTKYARAGLMSDKEVKDKVEAAISMVDSFVPMKDLYVEALSESLRLGHSPYDIFYFILARRNAATLFTMDQRLIDLAMRNGLNCVFEAEMAPGESWTIRAEIEDAAKL